jgi:hypothetical protein
MISAVLIIKLALCLCVILFIMGLCLMLLRNQALWIMIGMAISLKAIVAAALIAAGAGIADPKNLFLLCFVAIAILLLSLLTAMATILRVKRFDGTSDLNIESEIKH